MSKRPVSANEQAGVKQPKLFFILGAKKSGTTWLHKLMDSHPDIVCHGEGSFHSFGRHLLAAMKAYNSSLGDKKKLFGKAAFPPMKSDEFAKLFRFFILERIARNTPADRKSPLLCVGEKDPDHAVHVATMMRMFPHASYIHIIRDPRDAAVSWWHHMYRYDATKAGTKNPDFETSCLKYAREWALLIQKVRDNQQTTKVPYHEIRYEALVKTPGEVLRSIFDFLSVPNTNEIVASCISNADFKKLSGGRIPGEEDTTSFFRKAIIGDWKNHMGEEFEQMFSRNVGELMHSMDYSTGGERSIQSTSVQ